jgi:hypothetical protein
MTMMLTMMLTMMFDYLEIVETLKLVNPIGYSRTVNEALRWNLDAKKFTDHKFGQPERTLRRHAMESRELKASAKSLTRISKFYPPVLKDDLVVILKNFLRQ